MIQVFRRFFQSKVGIVITLAFLGLIALAFASMDVANTATFGGIAGGDRVAVVGDRRIDAAELSSNATSALNQVRQQDPTITMEAFAAEGGVDRVYEQMLSRAALAEFGRRHGIRAGRRLVDSEISQIPAFRDVTGNFSMDVYRAALRQQGLTDAVVREDLAMGLYARQLVVPLAIAAQLPQSAAQRYAQLLRESREGAIALVPSDAFAPSQAPSAEQLEAYYQENRARYIRPERRVIRYAVFGEEDLGELPAATEAQIAERYQRDQAQYAAQEDRVLTQVVVPTESAARQLVTAASEAVSLEAAADAQGFSTTRIGPIQRSTLAGQISAAVAEAAFAASQGALSTPARGPLGWYVLRVDSVEARAARTLAQARAEITEALVTEQRNAALGDLSARIEEELDSRRTLTEVAGELGVQVQQTRPTTASGQIYGTTQSVPAQLGPVLETAFAMGEEQPQLAVIEAGRLFMVFDVATITPAAAAPLAEIREQVVAAWRRDQGFAAAREASARIMQRVEQGQSLAAALAAEDAELPPVDEVNIDRQDIAASGQVPPPLALLFSMAEGSVKRLTAGDNAGWFVVALNDIVTPELEPGDPLIMVTAGQLQGVLGDEFAEQFINAARSEVGIQRNQAAVNAVIAQLTGRGD